MTDPGFDQLPSNANYDMIYHIGQSRYFGTIPDEAKKAKGLIISGQTVQKNLYTSSNLQFCQGLDPLFGQGWVSTSFRLNPNNHISSHVYVGLAGLFEDYMDTLNSYDPHAFLIDGFNGQAHMSGKFHDFIRKHGDNAIEPGSIITVHLN